ncbi:MAG: sensor histidine kinase [Hyphomicrobiales bacterium]|nr:sensor histidine kinase [Hyphomicrobiales bacterium]
MLMGFVVVPVAILTVMLAAAADETLSSDIKRAWRQSTADYVLHAQFWLRGVVRTLNTAAAAANAQGGDCSRLLTDIVKVDEGFRAIEVRLSDGRTCAGGLNAELVGAVGRASAALSGQPHVPFPVGQQVAVGVYAAEGRQVAVQAEAPPTAAQKWTATALIDAALLDALFQPRPSKKDAVALVERGQKVIVGDGVDAADRSWLPHAETISEAYALADARSESGAMESYATQTVLAPQYYILRRFDTSPRQAAWFRFLVLSLAPLATLAILYAVYSWAIQSEVLRWIEGIKAAILARRRGQTAKAFAPMDVGMPSELRDFAATFNEMARESTIREDSLKRSLAENEFLLRELHHRVKNSLQIIQSYLALTRRLDGVSADCEPIAAMEARVQVLAIAYRIAFAEGRMRDVRVRPFVEELTRNLSHAFHHEGLTLELDAQITTALMIDRAIPMGLALVEAVMAGLKAERAHYVRIVIVERERRQLAISVSTDGKLADGKPEEQLMAGLARQLAATTEPLAPGAVMCWRFQGGPPPVSSEGVAATSRQIGPTSRSASA